MPACNQETLVLFNPPFCGEILFQAIRSFNKESKISFAFPLAYLILPIVLHEPSRLSVSENNRKKLHVWLQEFPELRIGFAERAREYQIFTRKALLILLQSGKVQFDDQGGIVTVSGYRNKNATQRRQNLEIKQCEQVAKILGRWFSRAGSVASIFSMWGVRP